MFIEAIVVLGRNEPHIRMTRALRPLFVLDSNLLVGVRRYAFALFVCLYIYMCVCVCECTPAGIGPLGNLPCFTILYSCTLVSPLFLKLLNFLLVCLLFNSTIRLYDY